MTRARILADYVAGGTTAAEFDYMDGVTSNVQTQMNTKAPLASPTFTGTVAIPNVANLETAVVANTAKVTNQDIDIDQDCFMAGLDPRWTTDYPSNAVVDFDDIIKLGSNVTHDSAGTFTPSTAGWYLIILTIANYSNETDTTNIFVQRDSATVGGRIYWDTNMTYYGGKTSQLIVYLDGSQTIRVYGYGDLYGSSATNTMASFLGFRLGA